MYVCLCHGVTDGHIREAVSQGVRSMRDLRRELGLCGSCGRCGPHAREVLTEATAEISATAVRIPLPGTEPAYSSI
ncbi:MAG: bacterioferritin-associated ferredoxin [Ectothiorhodospiraceae bacterium]|nr:bacterioferritin-associated ferredoxin [Ectothiorhodospiraceae bacterium]